MPRKSSSKIDKRQLKEIVEKIERIKYIKFPFSVSQRKVIAKLENAAKKIKTQTELNKLSEQYHNFINNLTFDASQKPEKKYNARQLQLLVRKINQFHHMRMAWNSAERQLIEKLEDLAKNVQTQADVDKLEKQYKAVYKKLRNKEPDQYERELMNDDVVEEFKNVALELENCKIMNEIMKDVFDIDVKKLYLKNIMQILDDEDQDKMISVLDHF